MYENILATFDLDESIALLIIKPLNPTFCHNALPFFTQTCENGTFGLKKGLPPSKFILNQFAENGKGFYVVVPDFPGTDYVAWEGSDC